MPIIRAADVQTETETGVTGPALMRRFSDSGGLTQFGAFTETLEPGSRSSLCHWHAAEDEFIYMLEGEATLFEGGVPAILQPGDAATFRAGVEVGHYLENRSAAPCTYLVVGTRKTSDVTTYPDHDRILHWAYGSPPRYTTLDGTPDPVPGSAYALEAERTR